MCCFSDSLLHFWKTDCDNNLRFSFHELVHITNYFTLTTPFTRFFLPRSDIFKLWSTYLLKITHLLPADPHTSTASSRMNWPPCWFKWTHLFRWKTNSGFCACAIKFQTQSTIGCLCLCNIVAPWWLKYVAEIYRMSQEEKSIFWEVIVSVILSKNVYMNMCPIPNGFQDRSIRPEMNCSLTYWMLSPE